MTTALYSSLRHTPLSDPKLDLTSGTCSENPWLVRMPDTGHGPKLCLRLLQCLRWLVCLEYLDWYDQGILQQIIVHHAVENIDRAIITSTREERVLPWMEIDLSNGLLVVLERFIGRISRHVHIEPAHLLVIGSNNEVVSLGVHGDGGYPLGTRSVLADDGLFLQVVLEDSGLGGCEEVWFGWMERDALDDSIRGREGLLGRCLTNGVNEDLTCGLDVVSHGGDVVSSWMP